jgi:cytochrome b561
MRVDAVESAGVRPGPKYDLVSRCLHTALATAVVLELSLQAVMHVPAGVGLGKDDWHRQAFELHAHFGPTVAAICVLFWLWTALPFSRPGIGYLFPWVSRARRPMLKREFAELRRLRLPSAHELSPLVGTIHGLGLLAVSATVAAGSVSYLGYYTHVHISSAMLHWSALELIVLSWAVWLFVAGHVSMALWHWSCGHSNSRAPARQPGDSLMSGRSSSQPDTGAS